VSYLDLAGFKARSVMPDEDVDNLEARFPGYLQTALDDEEAWINARLKKRYAVPFDAPAPTVVVRWLVHLVTPRAYERRGWNASSAQDQEILNAAQTARDEVKEAANSDEGLFDLPLRQDALKGSGISQGGPFGYAEASPYTWTGRQWEAARGE
jgi:phage gp36-like protein